MFISIYIYSWKLLVYNIIWTAHLASDSQLALSSLGWPPFLLPISLGCLYPSVQGRGQRARPCPPWHAHWSYPCSVHVLEVMLVRLFFNCMTFQYISCLEGKKTGQWVFSVIQGPALWGSSSSLPLSLIKETMLRINIAFLYRTWGGFLKISFENFKVLFVFLITCIYLGKGTWVQVAGRPESQAVVSFDVDAANQTQSSARASTLKFWAISNLCFCLFVCSILFLLCLLVTSGKADSFCRK